MPTPSGPSPRSRLPPGAVAAVLVALALAAQARVLGGGWVLDDTATVANDPVVRRGPGAIGEAFSRRPEPAAPWRPLARATHTIEAALFARDDGTLDPTGFHGVNWLLHAACAALLFAVLRRLAPGRPALAVTTAAVFAVHPIVTSTVAPVTGRADLLAVLLSLGAALAFLRHVAGRSEWLPVAGLTFFLALMASPVVVGVPLVLLVAGLRGAEGARRGRALAGAAVLFAVVVIFLVVWPGRPEPLADVPPQGVATRVAVGTIGVVRNAVRLFLPVGFVGDHGDEALPGVGWELGKVQAAVVAAALLAFLAALLRLASRRTGAWAHAVLATAAVAVPAMLVLPAGAPVETRFVYAAATPLFVFAGLVLEPCLAPNPGRRRLQPLPWGAVAVGAIVLLATLAHHEARAWRDDETFYARLLERKPLHVRALVREARRLRERAAFAQRRASEQPIGPDRQLTAEGRRWKEERARALERAHSRLTRAVNQPVGAESPEAWLELGRVYAAVGEPARALKALEKAHRFHRVASRSGDLPADATAGERRLAAEIWMEIGHANRLMGQTREEAEAYRNAVEVAPQDPAALERTGLALVKLRRWSDAIDYLDRALAANEDPAARDRLLAEREHQRTRGREMALRLLAEGRREPPGREESATRLFEDALQADDTLAEVWMELGWLRGSYWGDYARGRRELRRAATLAEAQDREDLRARIEGLRDKLRELESAEDG